GLVSKWSRAGENLVFRIDWVGRSTPAVFDGRVCASGRGDLRYELVGCWDARDGRPLWQRRFVVYNTTIPFSRVGWASVSGDPETGYLYAQNGDGQLVCFDRQGKTVWEWRLRSEEHTSELQSRVDLVCRLLLEKKKTKSTYINAGVQLRTRQL